MLFLMDMKKWARGISLLTLAAFLGFTSVVALHTHAQAQEPSHCTVCKLAHQTPSIMDRPALVDHTFEALHASPVLDSPLYAHVVATSHGLSPPTL